MGEQVTIVRIAIEEILEEAILVSMPMYVHTYVRAHTFACTSVYACTQITYACEHTSAGCSRATATMADCCWSRLRYVRNNTAD